MTDLDLSLLRAFLSLADELNFTRAARQLFISQPSLSNQIRRLEQQVGVSLFERTSRRVELTPAGAAFHPGAIQILRSVDHAVTQVRNAAGDAGMSTLTSLVSADIRADPTERVIGAGF